jgi:hypothetical protein
MSSAADTVVPIVESVMIAAADELELLLVVVVNASLASDVGAVLSMFAEGEELVAITVVEFVL